MQMNAMRAEEGVGATAPSISRPPLAYNIPEALRIVGIGRTKLYDEMTSGRLKSFVLCGRRIIMHEDLLAWLTAARNGDHE